MSTDNQQKRPADDSSARGRKPRGLGGVILILALLMALFVVVSKQGATDASVDSFFLKLFNGRILTVDSSGPLVKVTYSAKDGTVGQMEVPLGPYWDEDYDLIHDLNDRTLDTATYGSRSDALSRFIADVENDKIQVIDAFFITEQPETVDQNHRPPTNTYLTAIILKDQLESYVLVSPDGTGQIGATLQDLRGALLARDIPVDSRKYSADPSVFQSTEPYTALI